MQLSREIDDAIKTLTIAGCDVSLDQIKEVAFECTGEHEITQMPDIEMTFEIDPGQIEELVKMSHEEYFESILKEIYRRDDHAKALSAPVPKIYSNKLHTHCKKAFKCKAYWNRIRSRI